jgi:transcriptional regulator
VEYPATGVNQGIQAMYTPPPFAVTDRTALHEAIERYSFAILASQSGGELFASHLPLLLNPDEGPLGTLVGHMARANPQWREAAGERVMAVFSGPHAYLSPSWYEASEVVPTWNYVAVHATGTLELIEDAAVTEAILRRTVSWYEAARPRPWTLNESAEFVARFARQIVAFQIPIERLEGKWKLSQNHPHERRAKVAAALERQGDENALAIARLMRESWG